MPDPRQQDHRLNRDELVSYIDIQWLVVVQSGVALQYAQHCNNGISVVLPTEVLVKDLVGKQVAFGKNEKLQSWIS